MWIPACVYGMFSMNGNTYNPSNLDPIHDVLLALFGQGIVDTGAEHGGFTTGSSSLLSSGITDFLEQQENYKEGNAYLNWVPLDEEQFKLVSSGSGFASLAAAPTSGESEDCRNTVLLQANNGDGIDIKRNGYLYIS